MGHLLGSHDTGDSILKGDVFMILYITYLVVYMDYIYIYTFNGFNGFLIGFNGM